MNDILCRKAKDNLAKQISCSWIWETYARATMNQIFQQFAVQGQTYFNGSGDWGAYWNNIDADPMGGTHRWDMLCTSPYITIVGGTDLTTAGPGGAWTAEEVWNEGIHTNGTYWSITGAISSRYEIPAWQQGVNMSASRGSRTMRNIPDVAMPANNILTIYSNVVGNGGGTSASGPLWAGFVALVNEQAAANSQPPVGFINPAIYAIGKGSNYTACFHDITKGNNTNSFCPTNFFAVPGYDLCTGWGTPTGQPLIDALAPPDALRITPLAGLRLPTTRCSACSTSPTRFSP